MGPQAALAIVAVVLAALAWYLSFSATRLDRLHARVEGTVEALDAQLVRRASVVIELATSGLLDPAAALLLAEAARRARDADPVARPSAESELSQALCAALAPDTLDADVLEDPVGRQLLAELGAACRRVQLARRFHNDAVRATCAVRSNPLIRLFRLAGHARMPVSFEMDDAAPEGLPR